MAENSKIQWTTHTFNPWRGCTKVATGCANCYADTLGKRNPKTLGVWGPTGTRVVAAEAAWREVEKWNRDAELASRNWPSGDGRDKGEYQRPRVFCASLADVFEDWAGRMSDSRGLPLCVNDEGRWYAEGVPSELPEGDDWGQRELKMDDVRARLIRLIDATQNLDWLLLTKRPENVRRMWSWRDGGDNPNLIENWHKKRKNVWLGTSISCQEDADRNIPELLKCRDIAAKLFLSIEPMIGPVNLQRIDVNRDAAHYDCLIGRDELGMLRRGPKIDWVIVGGESGPGARPCALEWILDIVQQCKAAGVPCFVKQAGAFCVVQNINLWDCPLPPLEPWGGFAASTRVLLGDPKGGNLDELPEELRVREVSV